MILRRFATAAAGAALVSALFASPASASRSEVVQDHLGPQMLGDRDLSITRGGEQWVTIGWTADAPVTDFQMTVVPSSHNVSVAYPDMNGNADFTDDPFSSLSQDNALELGEIDVAAFQVTTTVQSPSRFDLDVYVTWTDLEGVEHTDLAGELEVRTRNYRGDDYELLTEEATIFAGDESYNDQNWIELDFVGESPMNNDFKITVDDPFAEVYYPQGDHTSLHHNDRLDADETDVARLWFDPTVVTPGTYELEIEVTYTDHEGKTDRKNRHEISVTVLSSELQG